jgi:hypothetical protein
MHSDIRLIAETYQDVARATPSTATTSSASAPTQATTPLMAAGEANEKKEKELPEDNWIRFKHILKSDADMDEAAVKIARLLDNVCADRSIANEIVRLIRVKNRKFNK